MNDEMIFARIPMKAFKRLDYMSRLKGRKHEELILEYVAKGLRTTIANYPQSKEIESGINFDFVSWATNYRFKDDEEVKLPLQIIRQDTNPSH
jgi:hypothetical protein